jgi:hypothetical protein
MVGESNVKKAPAMADVRQLDAVDGILDRAKKHGALSIKVSIGDISVEAILAPLQEARKPGQEREEADEVTTWSS